MSAPPSRLSWANSHGAPARSWTRWARSTSSSVKRALVERGGSLALLAEVGVTGRRASRHRLGSTV
jgi:hypothetical protein